VERGQRVGPFSLRNDTTRGYAVRVTPVLLTQRRDGGLGVRDDAVGLAAARRLLRSEVTRFDLPPAGAQSVLGLVRRPSREGGLYASLIFRASPRPLPGMRRGARPKLPQIENVLELTASMFLDPPASERRIRLRSGGPIRAEQAGDRTLRLLAPVLNKGNAYEPVTGRVRVRDRRGKVLLSERLKRIRVLPNATVDLPAEVTEPLGPGTYALEATLEASGRRTTARGRMRLVGVNEIEARAARFASVPAPAAFRREPVEVEATYLNTGNAPYAPAAEVQVRRRTAAGAGPVAATVPLRAAGETAPGQAGTLKGTVELAPDAQTYELTLRLLDGGRLLDSRSVSVTPGERPSIIARTVDVAVGSPAALWIAILAMLAAGGVILARYTRRLKRAAARGSDEHAVSAPAREPERAGHL